MILELGLEMKTCGARIRVEILREKRRITSVLSANQSHLVLQWKLEELLALAEYSGEHLVFDAVIHQVEEAMLDTRLLNNSISLSPLFFFRNSRVSHSAKPK